MALICRECGAEFERKGRKGVVPTICYECRKVLNSRSSRESMRRKWRERPEEARYERFAQNMKYKFKMTPDDYQRKLDIQSGRCGVCGTDKCVTGRRFAVDHDRLCCPSDVTCGECVRGLLCANCNRHFGWYEKYQAAIQEYQKEWLSRL